VSFEQFAREALIAATDFSALAAASRPDDFLARLVQSAAAVAMNEALPSLVPLLSCLSDVISLLSGDSEAVGLVSDALVRLAGRILKRQLDADVGAVVPVVHGILKFRLLDFARLSDQFVEKVFYLVDLSISSSPDFLGLTLDLLLETLKVERPRGACGRVSARLLEVERPFSETGVEIYSLYICCCETIAAFHPTDSDDLAEELRHSKGNDGSDCREIGLPVQP
jgi:hypothetical protein